MLNIKNCTFLPSLKLMSNFDTFMMFHTIFTLQGSFNVLVARQFKKKKIPIMRNDGLVLWKQSAYCNRIEKCMALGGAGRMKHTTLCDCSCFYILNALGERLLFCQGMSSSCCGGSRWKEDRSFSWWKTRNVHLGLIHVLVLFS